MKAKGHKVVATNKSDCWNNVEVFVNQENVFKCNMGDLDFGGDGELDQLVVRIEEAVTKAF